MRSETVAGCVYNARERVEHGRWVTELESVGETLSLSDEAIACGVDLFLGDVPERERSKRAAMAASLYAGALIAGDGRTQSAVAEAAGVSRLSIQQRWKTRLADAGLEPPSW